MDGDSAFSDPSTVNIAGVEVPAGDIFIKAESVILVGLLSLKGGNGGTSSSPGGGGGGGWINIKWQKSLVDNSNSLI